MSGGFLRTMDVINIKSIVKNDFFGYFSQLAIEFYDLERGGMSD
jgi:hypothetical protein